MAIQNSLLAQLVSRRNNQLSQIQAYGQSGNAALTPSQPVSPVQAPGSKLAGLVNQLAGSMMKQPGTGGGTSASGASPLDPRTSARVAAEANSKASMVDPRVAARGAAPNTGAVGTLKDTLSSSLGSVQSAVSSAIPSAVTGAAEAAGAGTAGATAAGAAGAGAAGSGALSALGSGIGAAASALGAGASSGLAALAALFSSERLKDDITVIEDSSAVQRLVPVEFYYKAAPETRRFGLIAEQVNEVLPDLVVRDDEGAPLMVNYADLTALLLAELQVLHARVQELETLLAPPREAA